MALRGQFMRLQSTLTSPRLFITFTARVSPLICDARTPPETQPYLCQHFMTRILTLGSGSECHLENGPRKFEPPKQEKLPSDTSYTASMTSGFTQKTHYHTEAEGGKYASKGEVEIQSIKKGDVINLKDLLFTEDRDYLVKNNNEHVKAEQLKGKVTVIYFLPLSVNIPQYSKYYTSLLKDVYYDLLPSNNFEVVFVASNNIRTGSNRKIVHPAYAKDPQMLFDELFSSMPWISIPYSDAVSRESIQKSFGIGVDIKHCPISTFIMDSMGRVLQYDDWDVFEKFGASGYPFSDERLEFMRAEDDAAAKKLSVNTLLASPQHDYVISNKGDRVPVCTLEHKVVALYFHHASVASHSLIGKLKNAYRILAATNMIFEVVLVYVRDYYSSSDAETSFWKEFKSMPWLALPFKDDRCQKLSRVFRISDDGEHDPDQLVIIGPNAEFVEPLGGTFFSTLWEKNNACS